MSISRSWATSPLGWSPVPRPRCWWPQPPGRPLQRPQQPPPQPAARHGFIHAAVDDHSRLAYAEIHPDETRETAAGFLTRAQAWFADHGITIQRVLTDNGGCYRSHRWRQACQQLAITPRRTRPYRPQTNGKVERFNRTLVEGWAYRQLYPSEAARRAAFAPWLHWYNHHRPHSALGGHPPISRCTNLPEPYT
jgi:transposase InsO family protein